MKPKINMITLEAGTAHFSPGFHPHVTIYRDASLRPGVWEYARTYYHVKPANMVRSFLAMMSLAEKQKKQPK